MIEVNEKIRNTLATLPKKPGCYLMKDVNDKIIYVGKAINLRNRVKSYFINDAGHTEKTRQLVRHIDHIEWIVVESELEAFILEMNLIKRYRPHYNIQLKDDKHYPFIKISSQDPYPRITVTRRMVQDGSRYFGPYTSVWAVHQTLDMLRKVFPYLTCDREITGNDRRPCLYYDIKLCSGPCIGAVTQEEYRLMMEKLGSFLEGKSDEIINQLRQEMKEASDRMLYERAAQLRDQILAASRVVEKQKIVTSEDIDSDVIAIARSEDESCVQMFFVRGGKLIGQEYFVLEGTADEKDSEVLEAFIRQYYDQAASVPAQMLLPTDLEETRIIHQWLRQKRGGKKIEIKVPHTGASRDLVNMAAENAIETLRALKTQWTNDTNKQNEALAELQNALDLPQAPNRIECYDISNTQGTNSVGSMVVFEQGVPAKKHYRRFNIKTVEGPNDFESMTEVLTRRIKRWLASKEKNAETGGKADESFAMLPDLIIMDGGKGQLGRAVEVLAEFGLTERVRVVGLAKREEELFLPGRSDSILLPRHSQGLYLVQRVRDEAHRFAITAHRARRTKAGLASRLDKIPGIGPVKRKALLKKFGSIEDIAAASPEELALVRGITPELAQAIHDHLEA